MMMADAKFVNKKGVKRKSAFTLVEILVIVGIIALLAAIAIPNLYRAKILANSASAKATLKTIANALESYASINSEYPTNPNSLLGVNPPYLNTDYFTGVYAGFTFTHLLAAYSYTITATPVNTNTGSQTFTITTGSVLHE